MGRRHRGRQGNVPRGRRRGVLVNVVPRDPEPWPKNTDDLDEGEYDPDEEYQREHADAWDGME